MKITAPAKVNFGLNIIEKRKDGFHNIETVFYPLSLTDTITIVEAEEFSFKCSEKHLESDDNLIVKTVRLLEEKLARRFNVHINLEKNIPEGAGLGGGSSDSASTLKGLNELFGLNLSNTELEKYALELGSDVTFFLRSKPVYAFSRGELFRQISFKLNYPLLLISPGIHISTKEAYSKSIAERPANNLFNIFTKKDFTFEKYKYLIKNDFEKYAFEKHPELKEIKDLLYKNGAVFALMSGSGSSIYGIFNNIETLEKTLTYLSKNYFTFIHYEKN